MTDHSLSANKIKAMGIPTYTPYIDVEHPNQKTRLGEFDIRCFRVPHNGVENRGFLIKADGQTICFLIDLEYLPYNMESQGIDTLIVECNYIDELVDEQAENYRHKVLGHSSLNTTLGIIKNCQKNLKNVFLTHASKGSTMDRKLALERIRQEIPKYINVEFCRDNTSYIISQIPF